MQGTLAREVVDKYPYVVQAKGLDDKWLFICASENRVTAEYVADALKTGQRMETRVVESP